MAGRKKRLTSLRQINEINLTPLMDLTFILLITFIITFPLIEQGIIINLPKGDAKDITSDTARTITIDAAGNAYLDDLPIRFEDLRGAVLEMGKNTPQVSIMVRGDESIGYGKIIDVLKIVNEAGLENIALVTQAEER